jgi:hypothetical protein
MIGEDGSCELGIGMAPVMKVADDGSDVEWHAARQLATCGHIVGVTVRATSLTGPPISRHVTGHH